MQRAWYRFVALPLILFSGCAWNRARMETKAIIKVKKDISIFEHCQEQPKRPLPIILVSDESYYNVIANEIHYEAWNRDALEHELHHYYNFGATNRCLDEQAAYYRTEYYRTKRKLRGALTELHYLRLPTH